MGKYKSVILALLVLLSASISWLISFVLHDPLRPVILNNFGFKYSDIIHGVLNPRFMLGDPRAKTYWYSVDKLKLLESGRAVTVYPYIDFKLEYPPVVGLVYFVSINSAIRVSSSCGGLGNRACYEKFIHMNYLVHSFTILFFHLSLVWILFRILTERGTSVLRILLYTLALSTVIYLVYNWDVICSFFTVLAIYFYTKHRFKASSMALGLATLTKIIPVLIVLVFTAIHLFRTLKKQEEPKEFQHYVYGFLAIYILIVAVPFITIYALNPASIIDFYKHHSKWYCENCIYQIFERDLFSEKHRLYSLVALASTLLASTAVFYDKSISNTFTWNHSFVIIVFFISLSYISSPQMMLLATPFVTLIEEAFVRKTYYRADLLNAIGILAFFKDTELRHCLTSLGINIEVKYDPWTIPSPTQILFLLRNLLLLIIAISMCIDVAKRKFRKI